jgi:hypothetical protein
MWTPDILASLCAAFPQPKTRPDVPEHVTGWGHWGPQYAALTRGKRRPLIVEVGAWLGRGTRQILDAVPESVVVSVDHWQGGPEHQPGKAFHDPVLPVLFETFHRNLWDVRDRVVSVRRSSVQGMEALAPFAAAVDLVYIDACHLEADVLADVATALRVFPNAVVCGDDYDWRKANGVFRAVEEQALRTGHCVSTHQRFWWYSRVSFKPVLLSAEPSPVASGAFSPGESFACDFGADLAAEAQAVMGRPAEGARAVTVADVDSRGLHEPADVLMALHDNGHAFRHDRARVFKRSAMRSSMRRNEAVYPGWPRADWPGNRKDYSVQVRAKAQRPSVSFCGVPRPAIRAAAIRACGESCRVEFDAIMRPSFSGSGAAGSVRDEYVANLLASDFALSPRGVGNWSYRLYEAMSLGRIPVLIDTDTALPFEGAMPWDLVCVRVPQAAVLETGTRAANWYEALDAAAWNARQRLARDVWRWFLSAPGWLRHVAATL